MTTIKKLKTPVWISSKLFILELPHNTLTTPLFHHNRHPSSVKTLTKTAKTPPSTHPHFFTKKDPKNHPRYFLKTQFPLQSITLNNQAGIRCLIIKQFRLSMRLPKPVKTKTYSSFTLPHRPHFLRFILEKIIFKFCPHVYTRAEYHSSTHLVNSPARRHTGSRLRHLPNPSQLNA